MTKVKQNTYNNMDIRWKRHYIEHKVLILNATTAVVDGLLVIARASRENIDLEEMIGMQELAYANTVLMTPEGSINPSTDKSTVIDLLEELAVNDKSQILRSLHSLKKCVLL